MNKSTFLTVLFLLSITPALAEQDCPSGYDFVISHFDAKSPTYSDVEQSNIDYIAQQIIDKLESVNRVDVFGHAATWGGVDAQSLSEQRAELVLDTIVEKVEQSIGQEVEFYIYYWGLADTCPIATNETQAGRATNRRVEVKITQGKSEEETAAEKNCKIGEKLRKADTDVLATSPAQARRLKFLRKAIADDLCGKKFDDSFMLFKAKNGFGQSVDKCGSNRAVLSAQLRKKKGRVMRGFKKDLSLKTRKKRLAKKVLWTEELITCETNKVLGALMGLADSTPKSTLRKSDECKVLRQMRTASYRSAPDLKSVYRGWQAMISKAASKHC